MSKVLDAIPSSVQRRVQSAVLSSVLRLPRPLLRRIAGSPIRVDGQELALEVQALLRLQALAGQERMAADTPERARAGMAQGIEVVRAGVPGVQVSRRTVSTRAGELPARLYRPEDRTEPSTLLVFYHGGGWVVGDLDTHDELCRFLAKHADIRVLSVDYRLAPEHPFPAAVEDAVDAYQHVLENAEDLGSSPDSVAVGGDSAGGNLAAMVAQHAAANGIKSPVLQLLLYPAVDASTRRRSRELFGDGFLLTDGDMDWFMDLYQPEVSERGDPRLSVLLNEELDGLAPAVLVTAGFDPLRDEGEEYARRLAEAGVPVIARRFPDLIHGFANLFGASPRLREAMFEIVGEFRAGLSLHAAS
ncbi:acetyl esterase [Actinopolyspora xinjiangensis]|uniref:Acetyl esterase n=1 Tax=Actinopolyspora xinjiangensis TaxID=405564 RepID=A0A1H0WS02_9ACTN|nr:alpha/beta hydrolase [Actinopolyspora xinjiangensis]SDP93429.1 acetyl esterase [Actinopolyspora xinjiangensis]